MDKHLFRQGLAAYSQVCIHEDLYGICGLPPSAECHNLLVENERSHDDGTCVHSVDTCPALVGAGFGGSGETVGAELLSCPFCGAQPELKRIGFEDSRFSQEWEVKCSNLACPMGVLRGGWRSSIYAAEAWNTRANSQLVTALQRIERWFGEFPDTGLTWKDGSPMSYAACFGSNGERDYMRLIAREALAALTPPLINLPLESVGLKEERDDSL